MADNFFILVHSVFVVGVAWGVPIILGHFLFELVDILENNKRSS
jgi:hypothetical protein